MEIDPRGPRFGALITMVVFAVVLVTGSGWLLAVQALFFALGTFLGLSRSPYGLVYRWLVRPRLGPPGELESAMPPRFAQGVGLVISIVGVIGYATGVTALGMARCTCSSDASGPASRNWSRPTLIRRFHYESLRRPRGR
jgi:hypothetical protein